MDRGGVPEPFFWCDDCQVTVIGDHCPVCHVGACELCGIPMVASEVSPRLGKAHPGCVLAEERAVELAGEGTRELGRTPPRGTLLVHPRPGRRRRQSTWLQITVACWSLVSLMVAAAGLGLFLHFLRGCGR